MSSYKIFAWIILVVIAICVLVSDNKKKETEDE